MGKSHDSTNKTKTTMTEIVFLVEDDETDGGYTARVRGDCIFTEADTWEELKEKVRDAVRCHYVDESFRPRLIRLHAVRDEVISA